MVVKAEEFQLEDGTSSTCGILFLTIADPAGTATAGVVFLADAEEVTVGVAELADAGILFPAKPAGILFPAKPAGILFPAYAAGILFPVDPAGILFPAYAAGILFPVDPAGILFPADPAGILFPVDPAGILFPAYAAGILFPADPAGILFPADPAGILFPADPARTVTADVTFLADTDPVTMGVTGLAYVGDVPLAVTDMAFPEVGLVCTDVANEVDVTPGKCGDEYGSYHGTALTDMWCREKNSCSAVLFEMVTGDLLTVGTVGFALDRREVFRNSISDPVCLVMPEICGWQRYEAFGNN